MRDWIIIAVLYALVLAFFRFLGGLGAAADANEAVGQSKRVYPNEPRFE